MVKVELQRSTRGPPGASNNAGCYNCGEQGHWAKHCPNPPQQQDSGGASFRGRGGGGVGGFVDRRPPPRARDDGYDYAAEGPPPRAASDFYGGRRNCALDLITLLTHISRSSPCARI